MYNAGKMPALQLYASPIILEDSVSGQRMIVYRHQKYFPQPRAVAGEFVPDHQRVILPFTEIAAEFLGFRMQATVYINFLDRAIESGQ